MEHTMSCEYPEGCSCGASKWNKLTDDPIVDSRGNTLSSYLLSGELPPLSFFKKEHDLEINKILKEKDDNKKYRICVLHEDLGTLQPKLEFLDDDGEWAKSGIVKGTVSKSLVGRYRVAI